MAFKTEVTIQEGLQLVIAHLRHYPSILPEENYEVSYTR
jgi:hypothetical protein